MSQTPTQTQRRLRGPQKSKACDSCKSRKIRCSGYPPPCSSCNERKDACHFGHRKIPLRKNVNKSLILGNTTGSASTEPPTPVLPSERSPTNQCRDNKEILQFTEGDIFIDRILFGMPSNDLAGKEQRFSLKGIGLLSGTSRVTFFSDSRLETLSAKLQNNKVDDLMRRISSIIKNKVKPTSSISAVYSLEQGLPLLDHATAAKYIMIYYERVHPLFPFLDRECFDTTVATGNLNSIFSNDSAFSALYHSVLALGCLHDGGGSFEPGKGKAWELFSVASPLLPDIVKSGKSLVALQAMTAAAVYALGIPCLSIEEKIMTDAARMAQDLAPLLSKGPFAKSFHRVFWVMYAIEKMSSFHFGRSSVFIDANIVTPLPHVPESNFGNFNWALAIARHCRLLSRALTTLFSPGICGRGPNYFLSTLSQLEQDLEQWRMSISEDLRPAPSHKPHLYRRPVKGSIAIWVNYLYYSFKLILLRSRLQINGDPENDLTKPSYRELLIEISRSILEITTYIDVEPSTPLWILAGIPICALFVLFDHVISDPKSPDTRSNLALLDIAGGHFSRIEFASGGSLPGSLISEFTYIAREYINQLTSRGILKESQNALRPNDGSFSALGTTEATSIPTLATPNTGQVARSLTPPIPQAMIPDTASLISPLYAPIETLWDQENDSFFGIDVMDIFSNL
ncbi:hypothetical protein FPOAC2_07474 [Fusarium poae]|uniref:Zn(2)-C6 fungal-type domain-containing protein n=1 Tax=Fusarium poae TaxID=36050 RepID=A0A1B8AI33_FUSPO|nr:hypothetical protein FPOAC1_010110 [Fusarium poae]KAG8670677.1 hypothetical protein FPOAC1_010110 [Fusarium poae]OBS20223.1 hypothetical protein FPOA_06609 [Fusarium poae]